MIPLSLHSRCISVFILETADYLIGHFDRNFIINTKEDNSTQIYYFFHQFFIHMKYWQTSHFYNSYRSSFKYKDVNLGCAFCSVDCDVNVLLSLSIESRVWVLFDSEVVNMSRERSMQGG